MKKIISFVIAAATVVSLLTACGAQKSGSLHTLYFRDVSKSRDVTATFFNSDSGESVDVKMERTDERDDYYTFSCEGDTSAYNMAYITYDGIPTDKFAFNKCVSGWYNNGLGVLPCVQGEETTYTYRSADADFKFKGYNKTIHIWTPDDYDPDSGEKYATIYLLDGQGIDFLEIPKDHYITESPCFTEQVKAMAKNTGFKSIIVAIDTFGAIEDEYTREDELVPDIGRLSEGEETGWTKKCCNEFGGFLNGTVVPYIQKNYNVYTDARHTAVQGVSLGGLASFYIAMQYPQTFGTAGLMSPSLWTYDEATWKKYLSEKTFDENSPFLYFYTGGEEEDTGKETKMVIKVLGELNYPKDRMALHYNENGGHAIPYWRSVFAEFLEAMALQKIEALGGEG